MIKQVAAGAALATALAVSVPALADAVQLQYWVHWNNQTVEKQLIAEFNQAYDGKIHVNASGQNMDVKLPVAVAGGAPPDVVKFDRFKNGSFASHGLLTSLDGLINADHIDANVFWPAAWGECVYMGKTTCLPFNTDARALYYNKDLFSASGLDPSQPPRTWDEAVAMANKLDRKDPAGKWTLVGFLPTAGNWFFPGWLWAAGGHLLSPDYHTVTWNSPEGIQALQFMADRLKHYGGNVPAGMSQLRNGTAAMVVETSGQVGNLVHDKAAPKWAAAGAPEPAGRENNPVTWSGGFAFGIPVGAAHPKEAWTFIRWMTSHEVQVDFGAATGDIPAELAAAHSTKFYTLNNLIPVFVKVMAYSHFRPVVPDGNELYHYYRSVTMDEVLKMDKPVKQILDETAQLGQADLDKTWQTLASGGFKLYHPKPEPLQWAGADWTSLDIGTTVQGASAPSGDKLTVTAGGNDIWSTDDGLRYVYQKVSGDFTATVTLLSAPTSDGWGKVGIMVRRDLTTGSPNVIVMGTNTHGLRSQWRSADGGSTSAASGPSWKNGTPVQLKLVRKGTSVTTFISNDGQKWTQIGGDTRVDLGTGPVYIGLAVTAHSAGNVGQAAFSHWSLTQP